jgi:hypothetical protein
MLLTVLLGVKSSPRDDPAYTHTERYLAGRQKKSAASKSDPPTAFPHPNTEVLAICHLYITIT